MRDVIESCLIPDNAKDLLIRWFCPKLLLVILMRIVIIRIMLWGCM